VDRERTK
jgi:hypothetical protein